MSVLAEVLIGSTQQKEPAATQALKYILDPNRNSELAKAFIGMLGDGNMQFEPGRVEAETGSEGSRPDLKIFDTDGHERVFVENKFWAPLTEAQPVSYLLSLRENLASALVFVVPEKRVATVWQELKERCESAGLEWENVVENVPVQRVRVGGRNMLITSWNHVLSKLMDAVRPENGDARHDIFQLQGLVKRMDSEEFLPLRDEEITNQDTARLLVNLISLTQPIVERLKRDGIADTEGLTATNTADYSGRYFRMYEKFTLLLVIELRLWRDHGVSPLWLGFWIKENRGNMENLEKARGAFPNNVESGEYRNFPIRLMSGVEKDRVIDDAARQIREIVDHCWEPAPQDSPSDI